MTPALQFQCAGARRGRGLEVGRIMTMLDPDHLALFLLPDTGSSCSCGFLTFTQVQGPLSI